jgi:hypothetical protein
MRIPFANVLTRVLQTAAVAMAILPACTTLTGEQATTATLRQATQSGFEARLVKGKGYSHDVLVRSPADAETLWIFIEGDGSPWTDGGTKVADDPTARTPLALRLAVQTPGSVIYLGRPCYLRARGDTRCESSIWTSHRYSDAVVSSMNAALQTLLPSDVQRIVLVGYSGGGTLAILMAQRLPRVTAVITIAGNLDTDEWSKQHRYWPLLGRNPADETELPDSITQIHLLGGKDDNITESMAANYLARLSPQQIWRYKQFGHVCCWEQTWPEIVSELSAALKKS